MQEYWLERCLLRAWPFPRGAGRIVDRFLSSINFGTETCVIRTTDNFDMTIPLNELIGRHLYLLGEFDRTIVEVILRFAKPGHILLDIGANIGYVSACFLKNAPNSKVIAVEPVPQNFALLRQNLAAFEGQSTIHNFALSDQDKDGWIDIWDNNKAASRLADKRSARSTPIIIRSTDAFLAGIDHVDILKIDTEGHEDCIINNAERQLARLRPRAIIFEHEGREAAPLGSIGSVLGRLGYDVFGIKKRLLKFELVSIRDTRDCLYNDYVAIGGFRDIRP